MYEDAHTEPLCGQKWLDRHQHDHSQHEIDSLSLVVSIDGKNIPAICVGNDEATIRDFKEVVKSYRKG